MATEIPSDIGAIDLVSQVADLLDGTTRVTAQTHPRVVQMTRRIVSQTLLQEAARDARAASLWVDPDDEDNWHYL